MFRHQKLDGFGKRPWLVGIKLGGTTCLCTCSSCQLPSQMQPDPQCSAPHWWSSWRWKRRQMPQLRQMSACSLHSTVNNNEARHTLVIAYCNLSFIKRKKKHAKHVRSVSFYTSCNFFATSQKTDTTRMIEALILFVIITGSLNSLYVMLFLIIIFNKDSLCVHQKLSCMRRANMQSLPETPRETLISWCSKFHFLLYHAIRPWDLTLLHVSIGMQMCIPILMKLHCKSSLMVLTPSSRWSKWVWWLKDY